VIRPFEYLPAALRSRLFPILLRAAVALVPGLARAEEAAVSPARQLFLDGRKLASEGKFAEACPKFEESLRLELGVGTQFNLADCWEHIGRTASARALFLGAAAAAKGAGQTDREQVLRDRATALEPRLSRLVVDLKGSQQKVAVKRDDVPLDEETLGKALPVDPGKYTIKARAPGKKDWQKVVEVTGSTPLITVEVPELEPEQQPPSAEKPAAPKLAVAPPPQPASPQATDRGGGLNYRVLGLASMGAVGIGVGLVMGLKYASANGDAKDICPANHGCSVKDIQDHDRLVSIARTDRSWSYAGFGVGGAFLLGAGALWLFDRPQGAEKKASLHAVPMVSADGSVGALVDARF